METERKPRQTRTNRQNIRKGDAGCRLRLCRPQYLTMTPEEGARLIDLLAALAADRPGGSART